MIELSKNILYLPADHTTDRPILAAVSGSKRTLIVDAGNSPAHAGLFLNELASYCLPELGFVVLTHWHWDHVFGAKSMRLPIIAHALTRQRLETQLGLVWTDEAIDERVSRGIEITFCAEMIKKEFADRNQIEVVLPDLIFKDQVQIDLGGVNCLLENIGGDHSPDCTIVLVQEEKTLFLGDCLAPDLYSGPWHYHPDTFLILADKLESYDAEIYVSSHGEPVGKREFIQELNELKLFALTAKKCAGNREAALGTIKNTLGRDLTTDDYETLDCFLRGV